VDIPTPAARYLGSDDRDILARFRCSTGEWYEDEVERFVSRHLFDHHQWRKDHTDHRVILLELPDTGLVALGSHEADLTRDDDRDLTSSYIEVGAVSLDYQGAVLTDEEALDNGDKPPTLGRYLFETLLSDIAGTTRDPVLRVVVAKENTRSRRLCDKVGLQREQPDDDERFVQLWGALQ
jgi:hypothetical protein